jgi:hypothetical protein
MSSFVDELELRISCVHRTNDRIRAKRHRQSRPCARDPDCFGPHPS